MAPTCVNVVPAQAAHRAMVRLPTAEVGAVAGVALVDPAVVNVPPNLLPHHPENKSAGLLRNWSDQSGEQVIREHLVVQRARTSLATSRDCGISLHSQVAQDQRDHQRRTV